ncbi:MAG TPA: hypothetical protein VMM56_01975, partial [Planctomycetaceae bacterium]|nr:hypothetical protein [Planctomycetaceae bacterium]
SPEVLFSLGRSYQGKRQFKDAFESFNRVWELAPDNKPNNACIAQCLAESARDDKFTRDEKIGELKSAIAYYRQALGDPRVSEAALNSNIGYCYLALRKLESVEEYLHSAEQYLNASLALNPYESIAHHHLVVVNRLRSTQSLDLFDRQVLENAMMYADGEPEIYFEAANGYAFLLRGITDESERAATLRLCLECCRKAIECGLSPGKLNSVVNNLKMAKDLSRDSEEMAEIEKILIRPVRTGTTQEFNPLIDPVIE